MVGLTSRPESTTEKYYYSLKLSDFISNAHKDLTFNSLNAFSHTNFEIEFLNRDKKRLSFVYQFEFFGYFESPRENYLSHSINLKWRLGES